MSDDHAFNLLEDDCSLLGSLLDECLNVEVGLPVPPAQKQDTPDALNRFR